MLSPFLLISAIGILIQFARWNSGALKQPPRAEKGGVIFREQMRKSNILFVRNHIGLPWRYPILVFEFPRMNNHQG